LVNQPSARTALNGRRQFEITEQAREDLKARIEAQGRKSR
jgi:hypothetical protein